MSNTTSPAAGGGDLNGPSTAAAAITQAGTATAQPDEPGTGDDKDWKAEAEKWRDLARKHEDRAKTNSSAAKELEQLRQQSMSDQEKAVAQARLEGRTEGMAAGAGKVAAAEVRAAAAGRMTGEQVDALLEATNLAVFIGEDGEVDRARISKFVDGIAPKPEQKEPVFPDLGQGARGGQTVGIGDDDQLTRDVKAKLGIR